jgi:hypothetical protein
MTADSLVVRFSAPDTSSIRSAFVNVQGILLILNFQ